MTQAHAYSPPQAATDPDALAEIERRVLWLSTAIVHHANRVRPNPGGLKVGGHQASSRLDGLDHDGAVVRAPASRGPGVGQAARLAGAARDQLPARRAGRVVPDRPCARSAACRATRAGLKDPDPVDYSTGSVGIGATAPIWGAIARRYVEHAASARAAPAGSTRCSGDAELDEGAVWEAVLDPMVAELGEVVWVVDLNRQSLDRVVPNIAARPGCRACSPRPAGR